MNKQEIMEICRKVSIVASDEIMKIYRTDDTKVDFKSDQSPVTEADRRADAIIYEGLKAAFPDIPIVTEEKAETHQIASDIFFLVDPLDGTKEFIQKRGEFTVNIAFVENGVPTLGLVYAPAIRRLFATDPEGGAFEEVAPISVDQRGPQRAIKTSARTSGPFDVVASKSHLSRETEDYIEKYDVGAFKSAGSSLKFCLLAAGEADFYPRLGRTMEWDTAAGHAVLLAAGGSVLRFDTLEPLVYGKAGFENPYFIATNGSMELKRP